jgi:hypothetical protein
VIFGRSAAYPAALTALGLLALTVSGCASRTYSADGSAGAGASATATAFAGSDPVTVQRAEYVAMMLSNTYASGPETESGFMSVIAGYGGGYVTDASLSGIPGPTQKLTLTVVLGGGSVLDSMQGETDMGPAGIACFTFTAGYYGGVTKAQVACPSSLTSAVADATATQQISEEVDAVRYDITIGSKSIPTTQAEAEQLVGLVSPADSSAAAGLPAANFATGTDSVQDKPDAALALPQSGGGCIYVEYRWIQSSWVGGGTAGTSDSPVMRAWAAPTDDECTGAAALGASAFLTYDHDAGG